MRWFGKRRNAPESVSSHELELAETLDHMALKSRLGEVRAELVLRQADALGSAQGAQKLGDLLILLRDDSQAAESAYQRADARGSARGALSLGLLLERRGDLSAAKEAYRRSDERGSADGALRLGLLLEQAKDTKQAEEAYARADQRGSGEGASNLGVLLFERGDLAGSESCLRRADERESSMGTFRLGFLLEERGEVAEAEIVYQRAAKRGSWNAHYNLGSLFERRRDYAAAELAFKQAARDEDPGQSRKALQRLAALDRRRRPPVPPPGFDPSQSLMDSVLWLAGDPKDARVKAARENVFQMVMDRMAPDKLAANAQLFQELGETEKAEMILRRGVEMGNHAAALDLGLMLKARGDISGARSALEMASRAADNECSAKARESLKDMSD
jgi:tetratricopeptide (TPR) repeat protein